jgi:DNA-binding transcriptional MocR family regulator
MWSAGKGTLQQKLARSLMQAVRHGALNPGVRLPSERALAQSLAISRTTVVAAYDSLREAGWVESRTGSGTRVAERSRAVAAARGSAQASALVGSPLLGMLANREGEDMIDLALGSPLALKELPMDLFRLPEEEYASLIRDRFYYPLGLPALREAIAAYYRSGGLATSPEQILVTNGGQQAIALAAALFVQRGDSVLIEDPAYFGALDIFRAGGARIGALRVESDGVSPAVLRDRITATAARLVYLTPTFQNPTGAVMPRTARREIGRVAAEFGVPIIDDCVLADLVVEGSTPPPIAAHAPEAPVITTGSLSKLITPGLRVGWIRASEAMIERLARVKSATDLGSALLTQAIAVRVMGAVDEAKRLRRAELRPRRDLMARLLAEHLPEWTFHLPAGGVFLWVKLPAGDAREFAQAALRRGVVIVPGPIMSAAEQHARFVRLPFLSEEATLRTGVRRLAAAWREYQSGAQGERRQSVGMV